MQISFCLGLALVAFVVCPNVKAGSHSNFPVKYAYSCAQARCNRNAVCIEENFKARCDCLLGYEVIDAWRPNICVPHRKCQPSTCGRNASCIGIASSGPVCICNPGYAGNPYRICDYIGE